jgi:TRAP-type C4-dicarboxylate transport system substrate-binding protein
MKKFAVFAIAALVVIGAAMTSPARAADYRWQFFGMLPTTHDFSKKIIAGLERIKERSGGRIEIQYSYIAETPYKPAESLTLIRDGLVQVTEWLPANGVGTYPILAAPELPFISPKQSTPLELQVAVSRAWDTPAMTEALGTVMSEHGARVLGRYFYQPMNFWSAKPLANLADFSGQRLRVITPEQSALLEQLGGTPMSIPNTEVYTSLQTNVIDGVITGSGNVKGSKWHEVLKSGYIVNISLIGARMVISEAALAELPEDLQAIVVEELTAVGEEIFAWTPESDQAALDDLAASGLTLSPASAEDYAKLRAIAADKVWPAWKERVGSQADEVLAQIEAALAN